MYRKILRFYVTSFGKSTIISEPNVRLNSNKKHFKATMFTHFKQTEWRNWLASEITYFAWLNPSLKENQTRLRSDSFYLIFTWKLLPTCILLKWCEIGAVTQWHEYHIVRKRWLFCEYRFTLTTLTVSRQKKPCLCKILNSL